MKSKFTVKFPIFSNFAVRVEITRNFDETMLKYPDIIEAVGDNEDCDASTVYDGNFTIYIFLRPKASVETIVHESWHAIRHMMNKMRAELENEVVAYHLGYLAEKIFNFTKGRK